jgi:omega-6 fatty acid desaturase (delta-12 desaturase)
VHHGCDNRKGRGFVWPPLDPAGWQSPATARRRRERVRRSTFGPPPRYRGEIWWRRRFFFRADAPGSPGAGRLRRCSRAPGSRHSRRPPTGGAILRAIRLGFVARLLVWTWVVRGVVCLNQTPPDVVRYGAEPAWLGAHGIPHGSDRYRVRSQWNWLRHNIREHAARHLDPWIPPYRLMATPRALASLVGEIPVVQLPLRNHWRSFRRRELFGFERPRRVGFPRHAMGGA